MVSIPEPILNGTTRDYSIDTMLHQAEVRHSREEQDLGLRALLGFSLPPWQRDSVWTRQQQIASIEGIFLGFGCGYYVVTEMDWDKAGLLKPMSGWLLDGQQRITSIRDFTQDAFPVFGRHFYSGLDKPTRIKRFLRQAFPCVELPYQDDEERLKEVYRRLNFSGTPHTEQDLARLEGNRNPHT